MNLENEMNKNDLASYLKDHKKLFFLRVCGTGMGACAVLLKEAGFDVEGADVSFAPPMSDYLNDMEIPCHDISFVDKKFLNQYDLIIVGNSVGRKSELAQLVENCGVKFTSFPTLLGKGVLEEREVLAVIGTHGKTTTSYFLTQMLESLGQKPGYLIGGVIEGRSSASLGKSNEFIIEGDEYDCAYFQKYSKFHQYQVNDTICTSLEFDHADIFEDFSAMKKEFEQLFPTVPGVITYDPSYPAIKETLDKLGLSKGEAYLPQITSQIAAKSIFSLELGGKEHEFQTNIVGAHNINNISGCLKLLFAKGYSADELKSSILKLEMVKRRQEQRGHYHGALVIDDFAHHPKAVYETVKAIKTSYPGQRICIVFEPVSATARSNVFQKDFADSFRESDHVIIADTGIQTTAKSYEQLNTEKLVEDIKKHGVESHRVSELNQLIKSIDDIANKDVVLLVLSNRTCLGLWSSHFVQELS